MDYTLPVVFFIGFLAGSAFVLIFYIRLKNTLKEYKKKLEKTSINSTEESSKVAVLEAKIATLEKALQSALDEKK